MADVKNDYYGGSGLSEPPMAQTGSQTPSDDDSDVEQSTKKRKRPMNVTCEACKARKVRCDRTRPSCGWCNRNDHFCEYKERKKPGLRAGYGRELESRLDRLEELLAEQGRELAAHLSEACNLGGNSTRTFQPQRASYDGQAMQFNADEGLHQQVIDPSLRPRSSRQDSLQYPSGQPDQHARTQNQYTPSAQSHALTSPLSTIGYQSAAFNDPMTLLPPYDLLYALVDLYFKQVNVWLPLLDRKSTLERLFGASPLEDADRVLLHALVAVSLRFSKDPRLIPESRQHYHDTSKQRVQLFGLDNSSVRSLQALVILALDVTGTTNGPPGWNLLALISRSVVQLGLAVETTSTLAAPLYPSIATLRAAALPEAKTWIEDEERRRLFWSVYLLDRYATIATAFEFALDEKEVDRRLPCRDDLFAANKPVETRSFRPPIRPKFSTSTTDSHGHFSYHCELITILGHIHQFLKRPIDIESLSDVENWQGSYRALDSELNAWHFSLPDEFANITRFLKANVPAKNASPGWIMLHAAYCLAVIRLNSSAAYPSQTSPIFSSSYSAMQRCLAAVGNMRQLAHMVRISGLTDRLGPPFAFSLWVCARVTLVHGSTMDHEIDPDIDFFVSALSEMAEQWEVARRYSEILTRVLGEYRQSQRSVRMSGERVTPSTVRILADMRRSVAIPLRP
jgi:Fungal specific transcription factor domain/Fungal Zn(2)-Cys(6) binuclear cluster domain